MLRNLNLRTRILFGYGVILFLSACLVGFLIININNLSQRISAINANVAAEAEAGIRLSSQVAQVQNDVDRFLQDPRPDRLSVARASLRDLSATLADLHDNASSDERQTRLAMLETDAAAYAAIFDRLVALDEEEQRQSTALAVDIFTVSSIIETLRTDAFFFGQRGSNSVVELGEAQQSLLVANVRLTRMVSFTDATQAVPLANELQKVAALFERHAAEPNSTPEVDDALAAVTRAIGRTEDLGRTLSRSRVIRSQSLALLADQLKGETDSFAADALALLTTATSELETKTRRMQQVATIALLATLGVATLAGMQLARGIARPIHTLIGATERINAGDYDALIPHGAGGEVGRLAEAFNQMTAALRAEREELGRQQEALAERNCELEQALADGRAATDARKQLAAVVRATSVPVVPILAGVIVLPLVGEIDAERAAVLTQRLLEGVSVQRARIVILDITGVPFVDAALATWLLRSANAAELLGARCVLVGVSPEVAQALVMSGADLGRIVTRADLRAGVEYAMQARV
jgi:anti-anti-sigma factor